MSDSQPIIVVDRDSFELVNATFAPKGSGGKAHDPKTSSQPNAASLTERLAKLEGAFDWIKVTVALIATILIGGIAFLGVQITRVDARISGLSDQVAALPDKVNTNIQALTSTLATSITAAQQRQPQVIMMPQPQVVQPGPVPLPPSAPGR